MNDPVTPTEQMQKSYPTHNPFRGCPLMFEPLTALGWREGGMSRSGYKISSKLITPPPEIDWNEARPDHLIMQRCGRQPPLQISTILTRTFNVVLNEH